MTDATALAVPAARGSGTLALSFGDPPVSLLSAFAEGVSGLRAIVRELEAPAPPPAKPPAVVPTPAPAPRVATAEAALRGQSPQIADALAKLQQAAAGLTQSVKARADAAPNVSAATAAGVTAVSVTAGDATSVVTALAAAQPVDAPKPLLLTQDLATLGERLAMVVRRAGDATTLASFTPQGLAAVRYALVALADEWLIYCVDWSGRDAWAARPLEVALFGSRSAGRVLFARMRELSRLEIGDPVRHQLAAVYVLALDLGFCGEWRGDAERLQVFELELRRLLAPIAPQGRAFPQAYAYCVVAAKGARIAPIRRFLGFVLLGLVGYFLLSTLLWDILTLPLIRTLERAAD